VEWYLLLFALLVKFTGGDRENEISILLIVNDLECETTQPEVLLFRVLSAVFLPLLSDCCCCGVGGVFFICRHFIHPLKNVLCIVILEKVVLLMTD